MTTSFTTPIDTNLISFAHEKSVPIETLFPNKVTFDCVPVAGEVFTAVARPIIFPEEIFTLANELKIAPDYAHQLPAFETTYDQFSRQDRYSSSPHPLPIQTSLQIHLDTIGNFIALAAKGTMSLKDFITGKAQSNNFHTYIPSQVRGMSSPQLVLGYNSKNVPSFLGLLGRVHINTFRAPVADTHGNLTPWPTNCINRYSYEHTASILAILAYNDFILNLPFKTNSISFNTSCGVAGNNLETLAVKIAKQQEINISKGRREYEQLVTQAALHSNSSY